MTSKKALKPAVAVFATGALCATMAIAPFSSAVPQAQANTYSNLVNAQNKKAASSQREAQLRSQLSGVKSDLADKIVVLVDGEIRAIGSKDEIMPVLMQASSVCSRLADKV